MHLSWEKHIPLIRKGYARDCLHDIRKLRKTRTVYPEDPLVFYALTCVAFHDVKAVILGQDPYHGTGQAHGLSFSVPEGIPAPPSLKNIFRELADDLGKPDLRSRNTDLSDWACQGVLLLNATLTVDHGKPGSHKRKGWLELTDQIISELSEKRDHLVFLLWGAHAQSKSPLIDQGKHLILTAPHPSPLSAYRGFFGCRHFSQTNAYLIRHGITPVEW